MDDKEFHFLIYKFCLQCLFFLLIFRGEMKKSLFLIIGFFLSWIIFFSINAQNEAKFFIENSLSIYQNHGFINGIIHPIPFSDDPNSWRATKTITSILICGLILIYLFVFNNKKFSNQSKILLVFIFIISTHFDLLTKYGGIILTEARVCEF